MSRAFQSEDVETGTQVSFDEHEGLALAMLDVEASEVADVEDAMRRIIASAPDGTDVALLLILAIAHAGDRLAPARLWPASGRSGTNPS
jgi:hypothetical protein